MHFYQVVKSVGIVEILHEIWGNDSFPKQLLFEKA